MRLLYVVAKAEYFLSHRLALAKEAKAAGYVVAVATTQFQKKDHPKIVGIDTFPIRFKRGGINPFSELKAIIDLFVVFKKNQPSLVHNVALKPALYGAAIARFYKIPTINAINGFGYIFTSRHLKARILRSFVKLALKLILNHESAAVIVQNQHDYLECESLLPRCKLSLVLGSGVDIKTFYPVPYHGTFTFTLVARMLWSKGVGEFVKAAQLFAKNNLHTEVRFLLVGSNDPENPESISLETLKKWHSEGVIEWQEYTDDIQNIYAQTHVAVLPSYREGLPKSLLEAMACGLPIITTDTVGCRDLVDDANGIKVPVKNTKALVNAFERCVADPHMCEAMGKQGRIKAESMYSIDIINRQVMGIYCKILDNF
jgi:glycosyltransferase involved in cell wall biosynthesis